MSSTGQCLCGRVSYRGMGERGAIHVCHCADCRRWTGGPFMGVEFSDGVTIDDPAAVRWYESSTWAMRGSCAVCGTALFYRLNAAPENLVVTAGSLADQASVAPIGEHIFIDSKPAYYEFADDAPRITGAETFARFLAAQEAKP
jgi:hypothetical protein